MIGLQLAANARVLSVLLIKHASGCTYSMCLNYQSRIILPNVFVSIAKSQLRELENLLSA